MKTFSTLFLSSCFILAASSGYAQKNARTTTPTHNLVAIATATSDGASYNLTDSTTYSYSGRRTGAAYLTLIGWGYAGAYDTAIKYVYGTGVYTPATRSIQRFDVAGNMLAQLNQVYSDTVIGNWVNQTKYEYTYDAGNNMLSKTYAWWYVPYGKAGFWSYSTRDSYVYDTSNNLVADSGFSADTTAWIANGANLFAYDTHHNVVKEVGIDAYPGWDTFRVINYWLNAGFKPDSTVTFYKSPSIGWYHNSTERYIYDAGYNVLSDTLANRSYGVITPYQLTINTYTGGNLATQEIRNNKGDTLPPVWTNMNYKMMAYDASNNMISVINQNWNPSPSFLSYVNANNDTNTFSAFNKITSYTTTSWNIVKKQWVQTTGQDAQARFYYDTIPGLYFNNTIKEATSLSLYPVPANNNMKVSVAKSGNHNIVFDVFDMTGKLYRQWSVNITNNYSADMPTAILPAGNYMLTIKSEGETTAQQFTIVH